MTSDNQKIQPGQAKQAAKTTIVGGQPPGNQRLLAEVPVGLEQLLAMAAASDEFAQVLRREPDRAVAASGVRLTDTERAVLGATPEPMLAKMVARVETLLPRPERRLFLERAGLALAVLLSGGVMAACKDGGKTTKGSGTTSPPQEPVTPMDPLRPMETMREPPPPKPPAGIRPDPPPRPMDPKAPKDPQGAMKRPMGSAMKPPRPVVPQAGATIERPMVPEKRPRPRQTPKSRGIDPFSRTGTGIRPGRRDDEL